MSQQRQTFDEQLSQPNPQQSQRQQNYHDDGGPEHSVQQLLQQQQLQQPIQNISQQPQQQNYDRQLQHHVLRQHHVQQNLQQHIQNFGQVRQQIQQINNPSQQTVQQIQQTQPAQNIDHGVIAFDNSLSFQNITNDNNNNSMLAAQSLPPPQQRQQYRQLVYVNSNSNTSSSPSINNDISFNDRDLNLNASSFNSRNYNEDPLIAAISHHMLVIKDYMMKINQHHVEVEQMINMLRQIDKDIAEIIEIESQKILDVGKGDKIPSKYDSEWHHPLKYFYQSLATNPDDDYLLSTFFWRPENFIITMPENHKVTFAIDVFS
nr:5155_t:CDS:2 [Entrophospora candida]